MNYEEFKKRLMEEVKENLYERNINVDIITTMVEKMNQTYEAMTVMPEGSKIGMNLNFQVYYDAYESGLELEYIVDRVVNDIESHLPEMPTVDLAELTNYKVMKDKIAMEVVAYDRNEELLSKVPHKRMEDMAVIYRFELNMDPKNRSTILVTHSLMEQMGITHEQLHEDALKNAPVMRPAVIQGMTEVLMEMMGPEMGGVLGDMELPQEEFMYVASVLSKTAGAGVLAYQEFLDQAAERLGGDFFILPSSIHELLLVPDDGTKSFHELQAMVKEVNATQVSPEEKLTDSVYHYDCKEKVFELAEKFELRKHEKSKEILENKEKPKEKESILEDLSKKKDRIARNPAKNTVEKKDKLKGGEAL